MLKVLGVVVGLMVSACSYQPEIYYAHLEGDGTTVGIVLNNCHGDYSTSVTESDDEVRVLVSDNRSPIRFAEDECADGVKIYLAESLGDRRLVNDANGERITLRSDP